LPLEITRSGSPAAGFSLSDAAYSYFCRAMPKGSAPGERRGGRQPGTPNKRTAEQREKLAAAGLLPLDVMLAVMRRAYDANDLEAALDAARSAAPYVHPRLAATTVTGAEGTDLFSNITIRLVKAAQDDSAG
jgi:hypothetical protein